LQVSREALLCQALRRDKRWRQLSAAMVGTNKAKSAGSIAKAQAKQGKSAQHFRAVQGFRYYGQRGVEG
jgi:hypothetical protein